MLCLSPNILADMTDPDMSPIRGVCLDDPCTLAVLFARNRLPVVDGSRCRKLSAAFCDPLDVYQMQDDILAGEISLLFQR